MAEAGALYGARHYREYHFLLTLSDHVAHFGLEHHESNDSRVGEGYLTDPAQWTLEASLLPHEYTHSWNGKYRRPAGLATPDYEAPMEGNLLWVYEGLTEYFGYVLTGAQRTADAGAVARTVCPDRNDLLAPSGAQVAFAGRHGNCCADSIRST